MFHLSQQADIADSSYEPGLCFWGVGLWVCGFCFLLVFSLVGVVWPHGS